MSYTIEYHKRALKFIQKQPKPLREKIFAEIHKLPDGEDIKRLKGHPGLLRLRIGEIRVIYTVDNGRLVVYVVDADNRGQIYQRY